MTKKKLSWLIPALCLASCTGEKMVQNALYNAPLVGYKDGKIVCEYDKLTETISVPLSLLTEAPHIVKLDNRDEATVDPQGRVTVTENYILIRSFDKPIPIKLFGKSGEYVAQIGETDDNMKMSFMAYDEQLDERAGRIYLSPWMADHLLEYDLQGQFVRNIPLARKYEKVSFPKTCFVVDSERKRITACTLPFANLPVMAWTQDMEGNIIDEIPVPEDMKIRPDFSHELLTLHSTDELNVFITSCGKFTYTYKDGQLQPLAGLSFDKKPNLHTLFALPHHIIGSTAFLIQTDENNWSPGQWKNFIIDRETLRGGLYTLTNDYWNGVEVPEFTNRCGDGYYAHLYTPQEMKKVLAEVLSQPQKLDAATRKSLQQTFDGIRDNDTGYLVYARLK